MSLNKYLPKNNPLKHKRSFHDYVKFLSISILLVVLVDYVIFKGERPYITKMKQAYWTEQALKEDALEEALPPKIVFPDDGAEYFEAPKLNLKNDQVLLPEKQFNITEFVPEKIEPTPKKAKKFTGKIAKIAIVIDDIGMNIKQSKAAINLPPEVTLALLPYAPSVRDMAKSGAAKGHELIIHTPMEAMSSDVPLGAMALYTDMDKAAFTAEFNKIAGSFDGYIGINNHMGSRLTQDSEAMNRVMVELKKRRLFFLDSKTIGTSIAAEVAQQNDIPNATRDVFLDHEETPEFLIAALKRTERVARANGSAIAIGHPKQVTMDALRKWIPTLEKRGFELVPITALINGVETKKPVKKQAAAPKPKQKNIVGKLTEEDELVIIKPLDVQNEENGFFVVREPTKEIVMDKLEGLGMPKISYPVN